MTGCEIDLRPGGAWRYVLRDNETGRADAWSGVYREFAPRERLVYTEGWEGCQGMTISPRRSSTRRRQEHADEQVAVQNQSRTATGMSSRGWSQECGRPTTASASTSQRWLKRPARTSRAGERHRPVPGF